MSISTMNGSEDAGFPERWRCIAYLVELASDDMDFRCYRSKVIVSLLVGDIPGTYYLTDLSGYLAGNGSVSCIE